ncbi:MAG: DUF2971 domain-containing protein [Ginsengibacter sp.]
MNEEIESEEKLIEELKKKYLVEVVQPSFPFIKYFGRTSWSRQSNSKPKVFFGLSEYFGHFKEGPYYFANANKFIHYTTLNNAVNIINDGFFRLNSLAYMDDPQELLFAGNEILGNYDPSELQTLKENIFCISFSEYDSENGKADNFDSWRLYGDNGKGVGIVFKFSSEVNLWNGNYLSKIHYGKEQINKSGIEETTERFGLFKIKHDKFITEYEDKAELLSNTFGRKGKIPEWIAIFLAFHKSSLYVPENEIRFLRQGNKNGGNSFTINHRSERTFYDKLFIKTEDNLNIIKEDTKLYQFKAQPNIYAPAWIREATQSNPIVEIEKIIIGYRRSNDFNKLGKTFREGFYDKNEQTIKVELSPLSEAFQ